MVYVMVFDCDERLREEREIEYVKLVDKGGEGDWVC